MPFYKIDNEELLVAPTFVHGPGFSLDAERHAEHEYPVEGWYWFDNLAAALAGLRAPSTAQSVTMRQARLALLGAGLLDDVDAAIASIPDETTRRAAQIEWEFSNEVQRNNSFTALLAAGLGLGSEQIDALFIQAAAL